MIVEARLPFNDAASLEAAEASLKQDVPSLSRSLGVTLLEPPQVAVIQRVSPPRDGAVAPPARARSLAEEPPPLLRRELGEGASEYSEAAGRRSSAAHLSLSRATSVASAAGEAHAGAATNQKGAPAAPPPLRPRDDAAVALPEQLPGSRGISEYSYE